jgi:hypothetical protein
MTFRLPLCAKVRDHTSYAVTIFVLTRKDLLKLASSGRQLPWVEWCNWTACFNGSLTKDNCKIGGFDYTSMDDRDTITPDR